MYSQLSQTVSGLGAPQASAFALPQTGGPSQLPGVQPQPGAFDNDHPARGSPISSMSPSDLLEACRRELQSGSQANALILLRGLESRISPSRHQDPTCNAPDMREEKSTSLKRKPTPAIDVGQRVVRAYMRLTRGVENGEHRVSRMELEEDVSADLPGKCPSMRCSSATITSAHHSPTTCEVVSAKFGANHDRTRGVPTTLSSDLEPPVAAQSQHRPRDQTTIQDYSPNIVDAGPSVDRRVGQRIDSFDSDPLGIVSGSDYSTGGPMAALGASIDGRSEDEDDDIDVEEGQEEHLRSGAAAAHPMSFISGSNRHSLSLRKLLNPSHSAAELNWRALEAAINGQSDPGIHARKNRGDIVSRQLVSLEMALKLFTFFMHSLNPIIMLFDPHLHTFDYIRSKSSFLFTTMLSASAKFIAPSIMSILSSAVAEYSVQAIFGSKKTVETVQSWMVMYFWKPPRDKRAWTYVGLISRAAIEIGLDRTPTDDKMGASELQQRERRNQIRTWMLSFMMDRAMANWSIRGRDPIVRDPRIFSNHVFRQHGDAVLAGFTELRAIASEAMDELSFGQEHAASGDVSRRLLTINYDLDEWRQFWQAETQRYDSPPIYMAYLTLFDLHIRLTLNSFAINLQSTAARPGSTPADVKVAQAERYCYDLASDSLSQVKVLHDIDRNVLHRSQDSVSIMVAYAACFLRALIHSASFTHEQRTGAIMLIAQTSHLFKEVSESSETTAALQADFLQSLAAHSQNLATAAPTPVPGSPMRDGALGASMSGGMNGHVLPDHFDWFDAMGNFEPFPETVSPINRAMMPSAEVQSSWTAPASLLPHILEGTDLGNLDDAQWDQIMSDWLQLPRQV
ncbi:hypothetical protein EHS25_009381 [Saitozyma podzolica]|uniref:Transcription factor domain-containing protein n=1 Tax=Saitozyma podzolica TaxID=1890683 RepID=A0A427YLS0_9TREE|nr:hypothetical protein EHS25_009381 [Saitozyma podzolica]